ncbi:MAG: MFS transporter [Candidatus Rokubacteria bacterium]|nr:MFS transporter [Candidatus Rokubacteria bacterium]
MHDVSTRGAVSRYRFVALALIMAVQTAANIAALGLPSLAPLIRADLGLSRQEAGSFISAFYVGGVLTSFPAGWLADRVGVRWTLLTGQALTAVGFGLMTVAPGYGPLLAAIVLAGVAFGAVNPTSTKGVLVWFPARSRATVVGIKQAGFPLGGALGALLLPSLAGLLGWRGALAAAAGLIGLSATAAGAGYREPAHGSRDVGELSRPRVAAVLTSRPIWLVSLATFLFAAVQVSWISFVPLYLTEVAGLSAVAAGAVLGQAQVSGALGRIFFGMVSDRLLGGRRLVVLVLAGAATAGLCVATAGLGPGTPAAVLSLVALGFGLTGIGWNGVHHTLLAEIAGRESAATAVGLCLAVSSVGVIVGAPLFGLAADRLRGYDWGWYGLAAAMVAALALLAGVREPRRPRWS